jgi:hypothetical protein
MSSTPPISRAGLRLYHELPEEYRYRDNPRGDEPGDLEAYLHGFGLLLDRVRATFEQLYADSFPQGDEAGRPPQGWVLPYLADLLGAELLSPDETIRASELEHAVAWRQSKGTATAVDGVGDTLCGTESVLLEGWKRVLTTPRMQLPPFSGNAAATPWPGTPDLRYAMRAIALSHDDDPLMRLKAPFIDDDSEEAAPYRIAHPQGVPAFPDSFEDQAVRTPDLRTPDHRHGHHHPRVAVSYLRPPLGFFADKETRRQYDDLRLEEDAVYEGCDFQQLTVPAGVHCTLIRCTVATLHIEAQPSAGRPQAVVRDSLIDTLRASQSHVELEYVTVLGNAEVDRLWASDCLFAAELTLSADGQHCVRYSRVPHSSLVKYELAPTNTAAEPRFLSRGEVAITAADPHQPVPFGAPGCGVLHPATADAITAGAEDHGEMGAYHHAHHMASLAALRRKLADHVPLGIEVVPVYDPRLLRRPPRATEASKEFEQ